MTKCHEFDQKKKQTSNEWHNSPNVASLTHFSSPVLASHLNSQTAVLSFTFLSLPISIYIYISSCQTKYIFIWHLQHCMTFAGDKSVFSLSLSLFNCIKLMIILDKFDYERFWYNVPFFFCFVVVILFALSVLLWSAIDS